MIEFCFDGVYYLGYCLSLGKAERSLLEVLATYTDSVAAAELAAKTGVAVGNLASTAKTINHKTNVIGGRDVIEIERGCYRLLDG